MHAEHATFERAATRHRAPGFTLVEMVTSLAVLSILVVAMGSAMVITARSVDTETGAAAGALAGREVVDELTADLRFAQSFTTRTDTKLVFTVPDRDGDLLAETISYVWHGVPGGAPGAVVRQYNGGAEVTLAEDVSDFSLNWLYREVAAPVDLATGGPVLPTVLLVVADPAALRPDEVARESLLRAWGFDVVAIYDEASAADYNAAIADAQVVYLPSHIEFSGPARDAVSTAKIGVVVESESGAKVLGLIGGSVNEISSDTVTVIENSHEITSCLDLTSHAICSTSQRLHQFAGDTGSGVVLALSGGEPGLVAFESGAPRLSGGGNIPARRVVTPWGLDAFEFDSLSATGHLILWRSLQWVMRSGAAKPADPDVVLLVVNDSTSLTAPESQRKTLIESWKYAVALIDAAAPQDEYDAAVAAASAAYVSATVKASDLNVKLGLATIGVVNEHYDLVQEFGFASDRLDKTRDQIEIVDNAHEITSGYSTGWLVVYTSLQPISMMSSGTAPGMTTLAESLNTGSITKPSLGAIETGGALEGGGSAPGRRVQLPWGQDAFDFAALNDDGRTIMRRSIEWAIGAGVTGGSPGIFGYETAFATPVSNVRKIQIATQVTLPEDGTITSISAYTSKNKNARFAIYSDSAGEPDVLLAESNKTQALAGPAWNTFDVPSTALTAGTYWLALAFEDSGQSYYQESGGATRYRNGDAVRNGFLSSWGSSDDTFSIKVSIHATYTPDSAPSTIRSESRDARGFTLIETVISMLIVGIMLVASLSTLGATARARQVQASSTLGPALARQMMDEVMSMNYMEPDGGGPWISRDPPGEGNGTRANWDDVDDYSFWSSSPPEYKDGTPVPGAEGWTRGVIVRFADPLTLADAGASGDTGLKSIKVVVQSPEGRETTLVGIRSRYAPGDQSLPAGSFITWSGIEVTLDGMDDPVTAGTAMLNMAPGRP